MNRYQLLKENNELVFQFVKNGIMSYQVLRDIQIFERYNELDEIKSNQLKYMVLGEEFELSDKRIEQIICVMNK